MPISVPERPVGNKSLRTTSRHLRERIFTTLSNKEKLYETAAQKCWERAYAALELNRFAYALELYDCAEKLYEYLTKELNREDLLNNYAAMLMNKGVALWSLTRLAQALAEYDKAIAIRERLVHQEQQTHLTNDLAMAYMNKALALERQSDFDEALVCYEKSQQGWTFCVEHLNMFWEMPNLLKTLRYRLMTLLQLQLWSIAAGEIMRFRTLFTNYIEREDIDEGLKQTARNEMVEMISILRELSSNSASYCIAN